MGEHLPERSHNDRDPLEAELQSMRPLPPSPDLGRRVGERLARAPLGAGGRGWLVASGVAAAACLATALLLWRDDEPAGDPARIGRVAVSPSPPEPSTRPLPPIDAATAPLPTRLAYHRALSESPEAFHELLNRRRHAGPTRRPHTATAPINAFSRSAADRSVPNGDSI